MGRAGPKRNTFGVPPREVTYLGEAGDLCVYLPGRGYFGIPARAGRVLVSDCAGREMWILKPLLVEHQRGSSHKRSLKCHNLHERFMHKRGGDYYNLEFPDVVHIGKMTWTGELAVIHYFADKDIPDEEEDGDDVEEERKARGRRFRARRDEGLAELHAALEGELEEEETEDEDDVDEEEEEDDDDGDPDDEEEDDDTPLFERGAAQQEWVHTFEGPYGPAHGELWALGNDQYYVPPGPWSVTAAGIDYFDNRHEARRGARGGDR